MFKNLENAFVVLSVCKQLRQFGGNKLNWEGLISWNRLYRVVLCKQP